MSEVALSLDNLRLILGMNLVCLWSYCFLRCQRSGKGRTAPIWHPDTCLFGFYVCIHTHKCIFFFGSGLFSDGVGCLDYVAYFGRVNGERGNGKDKKKRG